MSPSGNYYGQSSYAASTGIGDIFRWYYGCPLRPGQTTTWIAPEGPFGDDALVKIADVMDGTSNTIFFGETNRFRNDPDAAFQGWSRTAWFSSTLAGSPG